MRQLIMTLAFLAMAQTAWAQAPGFGVSLWGDLKETTIHSDGTVSEVDFHGAPLIVGAGGGGETWSLEGTFSYTKLFPIQASPIWAFSDGEVGKAMNITGVIGWKFTEFTKARFGVSHDYLERTYDVYDARTRRWSPLYLETNYTGGVLGLAVDTSTVSNWVVGTTFDFLPYIRMKEFSSTGTSMVSQSARNYGLAWEGHAGYRFGDHVAVTGGYNWRKLWTRSVSTGSRFQTRFRGAYVGVSFIF